MSIVRRGGGYLGAAGLLCAAVSASAACGAVSEAQPAAPAATSARSAGAVANGRELGLFPGEAMTFEVSLAGIVGGEGAFAVGELEQLDGKKQLAVRSRLATVGAAALLKKVVDDATTWVDVETGLPTNLTSDVTMGGDRFVAQCRFDGGKVAVDFWRNQQPEPTRTGFDFGPDDAHTAHSIMAALRSWRPAPGTTRTVYVVGGRRIWRSDLVFVGKESIPTRLGTRAAARLDGVAMRSRPDRSIDDKAKRREFSVWLSDDADMVPLRVKSTTELGDVLIELTDYQRP